MSFSHLVVYISKCIYLQAIVDIELETTVDQI